MATREEHIKKINAELELLSDEELDKVVGGLLGETAEDSEILYDYGLIDDWHGELHVMFHWDSDSKAVDAGWSKAGITSVTSPFNGNRYFVGGKEITREEAFKKVRAQFTRIHNTYYGEY